MKKLKTWALIALAVLMVSAPIVVFAQGEGEAAPDLALLWIVATSVGQLVVGAITKKTPVPNELIPHINTLVGAVLYVGLGGMGVKEALLAAMAAAHGATMLAETATLAKKSSAGGQ